MTSSRASANRQPRRRKRTRVQAPSSARGYGTEHRKLRAALIAAWVPGDPCARCGQPMWGPPSRIHLGHSDDRTTWTGLEHASCNTSDGATRGNKKRAAAARTVTALPPLPLMRRW